ncbi:MAG: iron donor protein CyaY [Candidatus Kinetoplastibacterium crithidii]|nr:MAG: iron donor protein CyaY [Candidatus Kinetoplastibacterium crithidii]
MTDFEFIDLFGKTLNAVSDQIDDLLNYDIDIDTDLNGLILNVKFDNFDYIVITGQVYLQELWLATVKNGGFHYFYDGYKWKDKRGGQDFDLKLSEICSNIIGRDFVLKL